MHIERVKLTARKSLPNYEHVIADVEFQFSEGEDATNLSSLMNDKLSHFLDVAQASLGSMLEEPAASRKLAAAQPLSPAVQKVVAAVRPTTPVVRETAPVVRQTAPVVAKAPAAAPGTAPTPEQMARRVALITTELTNAELSTAMFLTHHGIQEISQHPLLQRPLVSARELKELVEALKHDAT